MLYTTQVALRSGKVSATGACPTADPGVASSIPVLSHTFMEIDHK